MYQKLPVEKNVYMYDKLGMVFDTIIFPLKLKRLKFQPE